jgi:CBS domain containing-hemolysin-like protein
MILLTLLLIFLITCSAFSSASETALFSLSSMKVKSYRQGADKKKGVVASLLASPGDLLVTIIMLNIAVNILVQNVVSSIFGDYSGWLLNVGVPLVLTVIFGEVIPKSVGLANNEKIACTVAPVLSVGMRILYPVRKAILSITSLVSRLTFFFLRKEEEISVDELEHALKTSRQFGVLNEDEAEITRGFLYLQESAVKAQMRPREDVIFFDIEDPLSKLIHFFVDLECSRIPVCEGGLDNTIGVITSRLFFLHRPKIAKSSDLLSIIKKPYFVPESMPAESLLRQMYNKEESIAIVVDEYASVSGIITLEDLVETVIGEISDRRDEKARYTSSGEDVIIASGKLELSEVERIFDVTLHSENNMVTIGGWLTEQLGDIPKSGAKYRTDEFLFHVLAADPNRVRRVYIRKLGRYKR